jgi:SAM-dependent methyltransferase
VSSFETWLAALEARHLANLTRAELTRALRALSSCYVERRTKLAGGGALDSAGKRAAFALFYAPLHFLTVDRIVKALGPAARSVGSILDLGCGTGAAGAAWALAADESPAITGVDRNRWALDEASWTYRQLGVRGRTAVADIGSFQPRTPQGTGVLLAYAINELTQEKRDALLGRLLLAARNGARVLVVEPIARGPSDWWPEWIERFAGAATRADEWRFPIALPTLLREMAKGAGLTPKDLTARSLFISQ